MRRNYTIKRLLSSICIVYGISINKNCIIFRIYNGNICIISIDNETPSCDDKTKPNRA